VKKFNPVTALIVFLAVLFIAGVGTFITKSLPVWREQARVRDTQELVLRTSKVAERHGWEAIPADFEADAWGNPIRLERIPAEGLDKTGIGYLVVSPGPDGQLDTMDDIKALEIDWNKSRIVGKWMGKKMRQAGEGMAEGIMGKNEFETEEEHEELKEKGFFGKLKDKFTGGDDEPEE